MEEAYRNFSSAYRHKEIAPGQGPSGHISSETRRVPALDRTLLDWLRRSDGQPTGGLNADDMKES
jgi:hypothetical protein